ncbi:hypothetical protein PGT21_009901 [Puccinia graminis f. sp. tritici]|uniref:Uncharacterized protein n=1 Tax=Puccinia graminis f. sp. tritici TaxID=56615 RepID=A0A5B0QT07_PUCGR|nr:hypothetical protein PGT21_009901 [Puccinia graminis f. sp. tritici]
MSTTSQSENESRSPARTAPSTQVNRSNVANQTSHRTRPYPNALPRDSGGRRPFSNNSRQNRSLETPTDPGSPTTQPLPTVGTVRHFGRPDTGVVRTWPPSILPFETSEADINDRYFENLIQTFDIQAPYMDFAEELAQYSVLLYSVMLVRQAVESLIRSRDAAQPGSSAPVAIPLSVQARIYPYQNHFKNHAKEVLMSPTLDVYSCSPVRGAPPAGRTLLDQVLESFRHWQV